MTDYLHAAQTLHRYLSHRFWHDDGLVGPDVGVRFNRVMWRFPKSYLGFLDWQDDYYYLQGQGYWVLDNWQLYDLTGDDACAAMAVRCATGILNTQQPGGYWDYPHPGWKGRIGTVEGVFAALGLLAAYERTGRDDLLAGVLRWYDYMIHHTGFQRTDAGLAINYFSNKPAGLVPNNSTHALAFFGRLAQVTGEQHYLEHCPALIGFLASVQMESGEFPYSLKNETGEGRDRVHFQCYQYHAFQLQHLAMYYDSTQDAAVLPLIQKVAQFIAGSVRADGSTRFDCTGSPMRVVYNTAAIAAALGIARRLGVHHAQAEEDRAYAYVLARQRPDGGFPYSSREYGFLSDRREYPRTLAMILYHLLLKAAEYHTEYRQQRSLA